MSDDDLSTVPGDDDPAVGLPDPPRRAPVRGVATLLAKLHIDGRTRRTRLALAAVGVILLGLAATFIALGISSQQHAPEPRAAGPAPVSNASSPPVATPTPTPTPTPTSAGTPMRLTIPAIGVTAADVVDLGLNPDQTVEVPPLDEVGEAGWYKYSPLPGQPGPAVILGHIDSAVAGHGVFFELGALRPGNVISVLRPDHMTADFTVSKVAEYPKTKFPTEQIYGNTPGAELRLITCGGKFDTSARSYEDNIVAYATLTSLHS